MPADPNSAVGRVRRLTSTRIRTMADALDALDAARELRPLLHECEQHAVIVARREGASWERIGDALGISRQAAQQRWSELDRP